MGIEHKLKGVNVALGPMMNLGRVAEGGRNWEGFGADPYLAGEASYETILGMQEGGVVACAKHLVGKYVFPSLLFDLPLTIFNDSEQEQWRTHSSSDIDDRTMHELYIHPFLRSVMAGVGSMMCSYSKCQLGPKLFRSRLNINHSPDLLNGTYACENDKVMNDIVKREIGFKGCEFFLLSDTP